MVATTPHVNQKERESPPYVAGRGCLGLGVADPQFSSPAVPRPLARAEARIDSGEDSIDPALLQASLTI